MKKLVALFMMLLIVLMASVPLAGCKEQPEPIPAPPTPPPTPTVPAPAPPAPIPTPTPTRTPSPTFTPTPPPPRRAATLEPSLSAKIPLIEVAAGETQQLEVIATDQHGKRLSEVDVAWMMTDKSVGSVTRAGIFTAGEVAGTFSDAVRVEIRHGHVKGDMVQSAIASVIITPGLLEQVVIAPNPAELGLEMTQQFVAVGADRYSNRIANLAFSWSVENDGGTVDETGLFTAGIVPGTYENTVEVEATQGDVTRSATANVTVEKRED